MERSCVLQMTRERTYIAPHVEHGFGISVSAQIVRCALWRSVSSLQYKKKKPYLSNKNVKAHFYFVRVYEHWTAYDWSRVIFSYELIISISCLDGISWCCTCDPEELSMRTTFQTIKHGDEGIMIWGSMFIHEPRLACKV